MKQQSMKSYLKYPISTELERGRSSAVQDNPSTAPCTKCAQAGNLLAFTIQDRDGKPLKLDLRIDAVDFRKIQ